MTRRRRKKVAVAFVPHVDATPERLAKGDISEYVNAAEIDPNEQAINRVRRFRSSMLDRLHNNGQITWHQWYARGHVILDGGRPRRATPIEVERCFGFPDDFTNVEFRGKLMADRHRYKMLGNSIAVPKLRWIGERIAKVDALTQAERQAA